MPRITANDLDVVNRAVCLVQAEMVETLRKYGSPGMDVTAFLSEECDSSGLLWMGELSEMVDQNLSFLKPETPAPSSMFQMSGSGEKTFSDLWSDLYHKVVLGTLLGYLHRMRDMSGKPGSSGMALAYEMSVLTAFDRWSDWSHLGDMSDWSVSAYMYEMSPLY